MELDEENILKDIDAKIDEWEKTINKNELKLKELTK